MSASLQPIVAKRPLSYPTLALMAPADTPTSAAFPMLVAITNDNSSASVVRIAEALATAVDGSPELLYVVELMLLTNSTPKFHAPAALLMAERIDAQMRHYDEGELRRTLHIDAGTPATWAFHRGIGNAASCIGHRAYTENAQLIVMGLHGHSQQSPECPIFDTDTLSEVLTLGNLPVLAVHPSLQDLPTSVVVAMDFSPSSIRAARLAQKMMHPEGTMHLIHVAPDWSDLPTEVVHGQRLMQTLRIETSFAWLIDDLRSEGRVTLQRSCVVGDPLSQLTLACQTHNPDLVVLGRHAHGSLEQWRLGTVVTGLIDDAQWSMLITPPE